MLRLAASLLFLAVLHELNPRATNRTKSGQEIYDLAWSPDGKSVIAGSVDHCANIYNVDKGSGFCFSLLIQNSMLIWDNRSTHLYYRRTYELRSRSSLGSSQPLHRDPEQRPVRPCFSFVCAPKLTQPILPSSMHVYSLSHEATGAIQVHSVGKNSRMDIQHKTGGSWSASSSSSLASGPDATSKSKSKGKLNSALSAVASTSGTAPPSLRHSDSDSSSTASTPLTDVTTAATGSASLEKDKASVTPAGEEEEFSMEPPAPRPSSSRRSSTASNSTHPGPSGNHHRSPSPAPPLPAVRVPLSPKSSSLPNLNHSGPGTTTTGVVASGSGSGSGGVIPNVGPVKVDSLKLYGDAASTPFFRRLCWSTDGSLLLTPAGLFEDPYAGIPTTSSTSNSTATEGESGGSPKKRGRKAGFPVSALSSGATGSAKPTVYIYSRGNLGRSPIAHLPGHKTTSIAIRFCPQLWELRKLGNREGEGEEECVAVGLGREGVERLLPGRERELKEREREQREGMKVDVEMEEGDVVGEGKKEKEKVKSLFDLKYRMVYAVATLDCVYIYDTQQAGPICMFGNLHYAPFTDLSWSVFFFRLPSQAYLY